MVFSLTINSLNNSRDPLLYTLKKHNIYFLNVLFPLVWNTFLEVHHDLYTPLYIPTVPLTGSEVGQWSRIILL